MITINFRRTICIALTAFSLVSCSSNNEDIADNNDNLSLVMLTGDDVIPIYQLITNKTKSTEVQRAVKAYIHSHQL